MARRVTSGRNVNNETRVADHRHVPAILGFHCPLRWNEEGVRVVQVEGKLGHGGESHIERGGRTDAWAVS